MSDDVKDEVWVTKDGREIPVGEMSEEHARNALRMVIRDARKRRKRAALAAVRDLPPDRDEGFHCGEAFFERPDNRMILANLRSSHGDAVRVEPAGVAGISGGNVYVGDQFVGWFGGI